MDAIGYSIFIKKYQVPGSGIIEFLFFSNVGLKYVAIPPSKVVEKMLIGIQNNLSA
jgi:hypothetical protein